MARHEDLKASKHDPKAFPSTRYYPSFPTKVFRSVPSSLSLCPFRIGSFVRKPFPFPHRSNSRFALDTNFSPSGANSAKKGLRGVDEEAMQRWQCGKAVERLAFPAESVHKHLIRIDSWFSIEFQIFRNRYLADECCCACKLNIAGRCCVYYRGREGQGEIVCQKVGPRLF